MKEFLVQNWYYLALILIALCNMILLIFKKLKITQVDNIFTKLLEVLPIMIRKAEETGLDGKTKLSFVLDLALDWLKDYTGKERVELRSEYYDRLISCVENILSTPEKKGDN